MKLSQLILVRMVCSVACQIPREERTTAKMASRIMMAVMDVTTAEVVASPTAEELRPDCTPFRHPAPATMAPKKNDFTIPEK